MNILPMIIGFILIFAALGSQFLHETKATATVEATLTAAFRLTRNLHNIHMRRQYTQAAAVPRQPKKQLSSKKPRYVSRREIDPPIEYAKLNLRPLLNPHLRQPQQHPLYPVAARLLYLLYHDLPIVPKTTGWEYALLDSLLQAGRASLQPKALADLFPSDPALQKQYYKMIKGTQQYQVRLRSGIPCLADFITLETTEEEPAIYFCFASPPLLEALFGPSLAEEILQTEYQKWSATHHYQPFSKEELEGLLHKNPALQMQVSHQIPYFSFHNQLPEKEALIGRDSKTGLTMKRSLGV